VRAIWGYWMEPLAIACGIVGEESYIVSKHEDTHKSKTAKKDVLHLTLYEETRERTAGES
jgi:hypothetical protein